MIRKFVILSFLILFKINNPLVAQSITVKPYYGYFIPTLKSVNDQIKLQIDEYSNIFGETIPSPGKFNGNQAYGIQIEYALDKTYVLNISASYYQEEVNTEYFTTLIPPPDYFYFDRKVELYNIILSLHYYFDYIFPQVINFYAGLGAGIGITEALSTTKIILNNPDGTSYVRTDAHGKYSGSTLSACFKVGADYRFNNFVLVWGELGLIVTNFGQLEGEITDIDFPEPVNHTTDSSFNFTGFFIRSGLGFSL